MTIKRELLKKLRQLQSRKEELILDKREIQGFIILGLRGRIKLLEMKIKRLERYNHG